jgi:hypothetical protein
MKKITAMQHIFVFLLIVSCKPPIVIRNLGMVTDFRVGWNKVEHAILRFQKGDTLQYMFDNRFFLLDFSYLPEINSPYVCYMPYEQSGALGVYTKKNLLPLSEAQNYRDIVSNEVYYLPLYLSVMVEVLVWTYAVKHGRGGCLSKLSIESYRTKIKIPSAVEAGEVGEPGCRTHESCK